MSSFRVEDPFVRAAFDAAAWDMYPAREFQFAGRLHVLRNG
ncbi:MAG TPA: hypothetical protein VM554_03535 [Acidisarcina sp.]|nr:hypothetical protein [Acidisarcina sp.]